jgi:type I restriction enzyme S subunit
MLPLGEVTKPTRQRVKPSEYPHLPFIGMEHIEAHSMKLLGTVPAVTMKSSAVHFQPGDVLYGRLRPYLNKVYRPNFEGLCSAEFIVLPENERINGGYLQYFLNSSAFLRYASHLNAGDRPRVDFDQLAQYEIPLPDASEQRRIVAEIEKQFSRLDEAVANLKRVKANLDRYLAATLGEAFSGKWADTEADWRPVPLRDVADVQLGQQRAPVHAADVNPIPYVRAANVTWQGLDLRDVKSMGFPNAARYRLTYGDILLAEASGSASEVGKPAIWRDEIPDACYQKTLIRVRCRADRLNYDFAYYFFLHAALSGQFARLAPCVGILHLTAERMLVWPTVAPGLTVQAAIVAEVDRRLSIVREVEAEVDANLKRAQVLRQAVLARAFSPRSREQPRPDEAAA